MCMQSYLVFNDGLKTLAQKHVNGHIKRLENIQKYIFYNLTWTLAKKQ